MKKNAATSRQASGLRSGSRSGRRSTRTCARLGARQPEPQHREPRRHRAEHEQRRAPAACEMRERDGGGRRERRADRDPGRVDARREARPVGEALLDRHRQHRAGEPHPDADRERQQDDADRARARARATTPKTPISASASADRAARADPPGDERRGRCEQAHAEHGDRAEQAGDRVRDVEVVLDRAAGAGRCRRVAAAAPAQPGTARRGAAPASRTARASRRTCARATPSARRARRPRAAGSARVAPCASNAALSRYCS